jgi:hypothetical protein
MPAKRPGRSHIGGPAPSGAGLPRDRGKHDARSPGEVVPDGRIGVSRLWAWTSEGMRMQVKGLRGQSP